MVVGLFCATLTGRRRGHTPFAQAGAEASDTGAEAVEPDPGSSWEGHSLPRIGWVPVSVIKMRSLVGLSAHCTARMLLSEKLMRCCAPGTNGCLDLRRRASALDGRVSAEWIRCRAGLRGGNCPGPPAGRGPPVMKFICFK